MARQDRRLVRWDDARKAPDSAGGNESTSGLAWRVDVVVVNCGGVCFAVPMSNYCMLCRYRVGVVPTIMGGVLPTVAVT